MPITEALTPNRTRTGHPTPGPDRLDALWRRSKAWCRAALAGLLLTAASAGAAQTLERTEVNIGVGPGWAAGGHAIVADKKGYFQQEGLKKVNLKTFPAGMMQLEAMVSGAVDFSNPTQAPLLTLRSNRLPVVVLASLADASRSTGLVIKKSLGVKQPRQLEGLRLGLLKGSPAEQMLQLICRAYEVDCAKITVVNLPPPAQLASLSSGVIDGMMTWQPWIYKALQNGEVELLHTGAESLFEANKGERRRVDFTRSVLASTQDFVESNPHVARAVLRAYLKAQAFIADPANYDEVVSLYSAYFQDDPDLNRILLKENVNTLALDEAYENDLKAVASFLESTGRLRSAVDIKKMTYALPLAELDPGLVGGAFKH